MDTPSHEQLRIKANFSSMGVVERDEKMLSEWVVNKLGDFGPFLGLSYEGFEDEILGLFTRVVLSRDKGRSGGDSNLVLCKRLENELKKLECKVNYDRKEGRSSARGLGKERVLCVVSLDLKIISWNIKGMGNKDKRIVINQNILGANPDIIHLQETKIQVMSDKTVKEV